MVPYVQKCINMVWVAYGDHMEFQIIDYVSMAILDAHMFQLKNFVQYEILYTHAPLSLWIYQS